MRCWQLNLWKTIKIIVFKVYSPLLPQYPIIVKQHFFHNYYLTLSNCLHLFKNPLSITYSLFVR